MQTKSLPELTNWKSDCMNCPTYASSVNIVMTITECIGKYVHAYNLLMGKPTTAQKSLGLKKLSEIKQRF